MRPFFYYVIRYHLKEDEHQQLVLANKAAVEEEKQTQKSLEQKITQLEQEKQQMTKDHKKSVDDAAALIQLEQSAHDNTKELLAKTKDEVLVLNGQVEAHQVCREFCLLATCFPNCRLCL